MAPIRRYLRITKYSVLEVRIYLDRPADADAWLLRRDNPALPRIIQAIRPLVLPKLREEHERFGKKGAARKKKGVKDVVVEDDFEVSIFLTDLSARHSVLTKQKVFRDNTRIRSNSGKLTGWLNKGTNEQPVMIDDGVDNDVEPILIREEEDDEIKLADIPEAHGPTSGRSRRSKRKGKKDENDVVESLESENSAYSDSEPLSKRKKSTMAAAIEISDSGPEDDDKKKMDLNTSYDGFSIYGRILCLVVKRRGARNQTGGSTVPLSSQQMLENWVSTQAAAEAVDDDEDGI